MVLIAPSSLKFKRNLVLAELQLEIEHAASQPSSFYREQLRAALAFKRDLLRNPGRALAVFVTCGENFQRTINHYLWMGGPRRKIYIQARRETVRLSPRPAPTVAPTRRTAPRARAHRAVAASRTTTATSPPGDPDPGSDPDPDLTTQGQQASRGNA